MTNNIHSKYGPSVLRMAHILAGATNTPVVKKSSLSGVKMEIAAFAMKTNRTDVVNFG